VRITFLIISTILVSGCASQIMKGYVGKPISNVVEDYGMPSGSFEVEVGKRAFIWQMNDSYVIPGHTNSTGTIVGNSVFTNTYTSPPVISTNRCAYVLYAAQTRTDIEGPAAWTVTGFKKPKLDCE
jgi:hypothetical protein